VDVYDEMMSCSRGIAASFPDPHFYESCAPQLADSHRIYRQTPLVDRCREVIAQDLARNPSHGLDHAEKVAVEAGTLVLAEVARIGLEGSDPDEIAALAQVAGLLHDMRRGNKDHASSGAIAAGSLLDKLGVREKERQYVVQAIANHEAFVEPPVVVSAIGKLLSDTLYDADKFRWGPDNFTVTLWEMLRFAHASVVAVIPRFPEGMEGIARIKGTFRSHTGRVFGPEFIDLGLAIGNKIYEFLRERFAEDLT
jgi:hypothetical protein